MHEIGGRTLLAHALEAVRTVGADEVVVVVGHDADQVGEHATRAAPTVRLALQPEQNGTGHAVQLALSALAELAPAGTAGAPGLAGTVVVTMGDVPLLTVETVRGSGRRPRRRQDARSPC
ncbi:MAG: NTP transferase domain-containing protein [Nocardioidaceae bacterium]